jgi:hypothetical protein
VLDWCVVLLREEGNPLGQIHCLHEVSEAEVSNKIHEDSHFPSVYSELRYEHFTCFLYSVSYN